MILPSMLSGPVVGIHPGDQKAGCVLLRSAYCVRGVLTREVQPANVRQSAYCVRRALSCRVCMPHLVCPLLSLHPLLAPRTTSFSLHMEGYAAEPSQLSGGTQHH
jgi:hypothetical protein